MASIGSVYDLPQDKLAVDINPPSAAHNTYTFVPHFCIRSDKRNIVTKMAKAAKDSKTVLLASDPDREGEAISDSLRTVLNLHNPPRIVFNEITSDAIKRAISQPRQIDMNLVKAQRARRVLDRLVGYLISPLLGNKKSAGRVQSVVLKMIIERDADVMRKLDDISTTIKISGIFIKNPSVTLNARFVPQIPNGIDCKSSLQWVVDGGGEDYKVATITYKEEKRNPPPPFTTSSLQTEAWKRLHKNAEQTMKIAQDLYQKGLITYMRTDSTLMSDSARQSIGEYIISSFGEKYHTTRPWGTNGNKKVQTQDAHECIRPTDISVTDVGEPLYRMIWERSVASQMSMAVFNVQTIKLVSERNQKFIFEATSKKLVFEGFLKLWKTDDTEDVLDDTVSGIVQGDSTRLKELDASEGIKGTPVHFNSGSVIKHMEETGVGRPSTYANTIKTLEERGYIIVSDFKGKEVDTKTVKWRASTNKFTTKVKKVKVAQQKKCILPTEVGASVYEFMMSNFTAIMDVDLTARMETSLDLISSGQAEWQEVLHSFFVLFYPKVLSLQKQPAPSILKDYGTDDDGCKYYLFEGKYGMAVRKDHPYGDGEYVPSFSSVKSAPESLEDAIDISKNYKLLGVYKRLPIFLVRGEYGLYIRHGTRKRITVKASEEDKVTLEGAKALLK